MHGKTQKENGACLEVARNRSRNTCVVGAMSHTLLWGGGFSSTTGHVFIAEQISSKTFYVDPQNVSADYSEYFKRAVKGRTHITRVDTLLPSENIIDCCENRS